MYYIKIYSVLMLISLIFSGCPSLDYYHAKNLKINNKSEHVIYLQQTCKSSLDFNDQLKEYIIKEIDGKNKKIYPTYRIDPDSTGYLGSSRKHEVDCSGNKMYLFIIKEVILKNNSWVDICKNQMYDSKIELSQKILDSLNWEYNYTAVSSL